MKIKGIYYFAFLSTFAIYLFLRLLAWQNTVVLEDHDSISYLWDTISFLSFNLRQVVNLDPDSSLFYPFLSALFSLPGWSVENGARLATLFSSLVLFATVFGIGRQIAGSAAITSGLLLLTLNPELIKLSFAILTEPSYVATVYLGLWLFWIQYKNPRLWGAVLLGIAFGLAFLNRLEGILLVAFAPLMLAIYYFWQKPKHWGIKRLIGWSLIFVMCFSLLAGLQLWRVSEKMGAIAINGRQVWTLLLHSSLGDSIDEKIYGLKFSPRQVNLKYLKENAQTIERVSNQKSGVSQYIKNYTRTLYQNIYDLYSNRLPYLIGIFAIIFFSFGILSLYQSRQRFEIVLILSFIGFGLFAPLLHNVVIRHILIVAPLMLIVAGIGVDSFTRTMIDGGIRHKTARYILPAAFVLLVVAGWGAQLRSTFSPPSYNREYSLAELKEPISIIKRASSNWHRTPVVVDRKGYLAYYVDSNYLPLPYADYNALVNYSTLNGGDFLYLKYGLIKEFPFLDTFKNGGYEGDFECLYRGADAWGEPVELYRPKQAPKNISKK